VRSFAIVTQGLQLNFLVGGAKSHFAQGALFWVQLDLDAKSAQSTMSLSDLGSLSIPLNPALDQSPDSVLMESICS
jgi:hypothetical protein